MTSADRVIEFRTLVKQLAAAHGYKATFMAKPFFEESGNGFHTHYSLWKDGNNVFANKGDLSEMGRHFVGGLQKRMAEASICGSATVNGYRRRQPYTFCPINTAWGLDNRTVGLRVIKGSESATRIEKRDAGADANPYLLLAADIAAGLDGIENSIEPDECELGNAYESQRAAPIPTDLSTAIDLARGSAWLKDVMGETQWEIYLQMCERELDFYNEFINNQVTQIEIDRYMGNF
jgi:glutamine synthetase